MSDLELTMMRRVGELKADLSQMTAWGRGLEHDKRLLQEENARLKAEVERLRIAGGESEPRFVLLSDYRHLKAERDDLKAEVERLTAFTTRTIIPNEELQAQVERLTKAGDNMYSWLGVCGRHNNSTGDDWLRAKKGLPSLTEQWEIEKRNRAAENAAKEGKQP
jgi:hypothetical protein